MRAKFSLPPQWRKALQPDAHMAEAEGLAAGLGLLTGDLVDRSELGDAPCPDCRGRSEAVVIDLVTDLVTRRCQVCGHRWEDASADGHRWPS